MNNKSPRSPEQLEPLTATRIRIVPHAAAMIKASLSNIIPLEVLAPPLPESQPDAVRSPLPVQVPRDPDSIEAIESDYQGHSFTPPDKDRTGTEARNLDAPTTHDDELHEQRLKHAAVARATANIDKIFKEAA